ncbi:hypothetical protein DEO72_LG2g3733 [Vigna unguiculata]|uniref:Uncharacterized protein n=1 Tax=Vigna unguiculata TaxID=3917 RepID=A0A4D6L4H2_VIGUN|nr:hypothetical protein DEO72_LG2g3733 [Vigna unguiculata]
MSPRHRRRDPQSSMPATTGGVADENPNSVVTTTTGATPSTPLFTSGFVDVEASFSIRVVIGTPTSGPTVGPPPPLEASTRHQ